MKVKTMINFRSIIPGNRRRLLGRVSTGALCAVIALGQTAPAWAAINNTVTVTATTPSGGTLNPTASETVDVADDTPAVSIVKDHTLIKAGTSTNPNAELGDTINYTYTVTNSGNVTIKDVQIDDTHDISGGTTLLTVTEPTTFTDNGTAAGQTGDSSDGTAGDQKWDTLGVQDVIVFTASHVVTQADLDSNGGGSGPTDGDIDNSAEVSATYNDGTATTTVTATATDSVPLEITPSLAVTKTADDTTDVVAGQIITYTYTITNNGTVAATSVTLSDVFSGTGTFTAPDPDAAVLTDNGTTGDSINTATGDSAYDKLAPGDVLTMQVQYTVTQEDIDTLQGP